MNGLFRMVRAVALYFSAERIITLSLTLLLFFGFLKSEQFMWPGVWDWFLQAPGYVFWFALCCYASKAIREKFL